MHISLRIVLLLAVTLAATARALPPEYYATGGDLSTGHWVKVAIDTTGVYRIDADELRQWGFDSPAKVKVYGYGGAVAHNQRFDGATPDALPATPIVRTADGGLIFYADGPVSTSVPDDVMSTIEVQRNYYDRRAYYFLTDKSIDRSPGTISTEPVINDDAIVWHYHTELLDPELHGFDGGVVYHGNKIRYGECESHSFRVRNFYADFAEEPAMGYRVNVGVNANRTSTIAMSFSPNVVVTESVNPRVTSNSQSSILYNRGEGWAELMPADGESLADDSLRITLTVPSSQNIFYTALDYASLIYPRRNILDPDMHELILEFAASELGRTMAISSATDNLVVLDASNPADVKTVPTARSAGYTYAPVSGRRMVAFDPSATLRRVTGATPVANQDLHATPTPDLLIVTTGTMQSAAEELAQIHRSHGLDVAVVRQEACFDEFGSGSRTPAAIRRFIKMLYDRNAAKMKYVLMYGPATCDPRAINRAAGDYLLTHECELLNVCRDGGANYATDLFYGMLLDSYDPANIGCEPTQVSVGRLSARSDGTAREVNDKVRRYLQSPPSPASALRMVRSSDDDNDGIHLYNAKVMTDTMLALNDRLNVIHADILYSTKESGLAKQAISKMQAGLKRGAGLFHYNGHGSNTGLTGEGLYSIAEAKTLKYHTPLLMIFSSCNGYNFDLSPGSIGELASLNPDGGAIGCIASSRAVFLNFNRILSEGLSRTYATARGGWTGADIYRHARNYLIGRGQLAGDAGYNTLCYNYAGDPAVPMSFAAYDIVVDNLEGNLTTERKTHVLARVVNADGSTATDFNGSAFIEVFDAPTQMRPFSSISYEVVETIDESILGEYAASVKNGIIECDIVLPASDTARSGCHMTITATAQLPDGSRDYAAGVWRGKAVVNDFSSPSDADTTPAEIVDFYIDPSYYISPESVKSTFTAEATIAPSPSGIAMGNTGIRNKLTVILDGTNHYSELQNQLQYDAEGLAHFTLAVTELPLGPHTLELVVPNNAGEVSRSVISFVVATDAAKGTLSLDGGEPVRSEAVFDLEASSTPTRLVVVDYNGNTVLSAANPSFPYRWNLRDLDGHRVPDGHYRAWVTLESDIAYGASDAIEFTIIK